MAELAHQLAVFCERPFGGFVEREIVGLFFALRGFHFFNEVDDLRLLFRRERDDLVNDLAGFHAGKCYRVTPRCQASHRTE